MYADLDGDGKISTGSNKLGDTGDRVILGNSTPRFNYGLTIDASWKGIDFRAFFQGIGKRDYWLQGPYFWGSTGLGQWQAAGFKEHWDFWRPEGDPLGANTNAYYPRVLKSDSRNMAVQSRYIQNAAYCRIKNVQIGYTLPQRISSKFFVSKLRAFVSMDNILTITSYPGLDPEIGTEIGYPLMRQISFGGQITF